MSILLNDEEQQLLRNASLEARSLYVLCLRPAMDVKTGTVGRHSNVALTHWAGHVAFRPLRGSKRPAWMPTTRHLERLIDELCHPQIGLVKRINTPSDRRKVVLLLPFSGFGGLVRPQEDAGMLRAGCGHVAGCDDAANSIDLPVENSISQDGVVDDVCSEERGISVLSVVEEMCGTSGAFVDDVAAIDLPGQVEGRKTSAETKTVAAFKQALGGDFMVDAPTLKALGRVALVAQHRPVTGLEMRQAVEVARLKGQHVAAYAASIVESGSLIAVPRPSRGVRAASDDAVTRRMRRAAGV